MINFEFWVPTSLPPQRIFVFAHMKRIIQSAKPAHFHLSVAAMSPQDFVGVKKKHTNVKLDEILQNRRPIPLSLGDFRRYVVYVRSDENLQFLEAVAHYRAIYAEVFQSGYIFRQPSCDTTPCETILDSSPFGSPLTCPVCMELDTAEARARRAPGLAGGVALLNQHFDHIITTFIDPAGRKTINVSYFVREPLMSLDGTKLGLPPPASAHNPYGSFVTNSQLSLPSTISAETVVELDSTRAMQRPEYPPMPSAHRHQASHDSMSTASAASPVVSISTAGSESQTNSRGSPKSQYPPSTIRATRQNSSGAPVPPAVLDDAEREIRELVTTAVLPSFVLQAKTTNFEPSASLLLAIRVVTLFTCVAIMVVPMILFGVSRYLRLIAFPLIAFICTDFVAAPRRLCVINAVRNMRQIGHSAFYIQVVADPEVKTALRNRALMYFAIGNLLAIFIMAGILIIPQQVYVHP
ncbi:hypothetical protein BJ742DRAFT_140498 [Cladochytrium replicatum]|nr:hypothetical protein BJ742DRAFT_140498 [Cladochytrium replicatum]